MTAVHVSVSFMQKSAGKGNEVCCSDGSVLIKQTNQKQKTSESMLKILLHFLHFMRHDNVAGYNKLSGNKPPLLEASKPPEGAGVVDADSAGAVTGTIGADGTAAGTGGVGHASEPRASKPVSSRSFCTGAGASAGASAGARVWAAVGARVGDISPEEHQRQKHRCGLTCGGETHCQDHR